MTTKTLKTVDGNEITIEGKGWTKGKNHRIYFSIKSGRKNSGQACWDIEKKEWVKVHGEFGVNFKADIKAAFQL